VSGGGSEGGGAPPSDGFGGEGDDALLVGSLNAPSLLGLGAIDALDPAFVEVAAVARVTEGRARHRFGWRAQVTTLREFVTLACATELGLSTEEHPGDSAVVELDADDVDALTAFVASLPPPPPPPEDHPGRRVFDRIGCADCHLPVLGGLPMFSDLLLHDMGPVTAMAGSYGASDADATLTRMWRTPPLWGVADTAPYLHDGRAETFAQAIDSHSGEAEGARSRWRRLEDPDRDALHAFLGAMEGP
jgi:CxxC motif-containing protein (DUF1111 family)